MDEEPGDAEHIHAESHVALSVDHHHRSLERIQVDGPESLTAALADLWAQGAERHGGPLSQVVFRSPSWTRLATMPTWSRTLTLFGGNGIRLRVGSVPWLCGPEAAEALRRLRSEGRSLGRLENTRLGSHDGLFVGRPLVPQLQLRSKAGVHVVQRARGSGQFKRVDVVPDAGVRVSFEARKGGLIVQWEGRSWSVRRADLEVAVASPSDGTADRGVRRAAAVFGHWSPPHWLGPSACADIEQATGTRPEAGRLQPAHLDWILKLLDSGEPELETDPENLEVRGYGDFLLDALWTAVARALDQKGGLEQFGQAGLEVAIKGEVEREMMRLAFGKGRMAALLIDEDRTNTLARAEVRRRVTRFGPGGLPRPLRGWRHVRDLHPSFRGLLCPLQTPESEDIGLTRYLAVGAQRVGRRLEQAADRGEWTELSAAAGLVPFLNHNDPARASIISRTLKQAVPVEGASIPILRTGGESRVAEQFGVCRAPVPGTCSQVADDHIVLKDSLGKSHQLRFGPALTDAAGPVAQWELLVAKGQKVIRHQVLAIAPDVKLDDRGEAQLALGADCLVAYMPWRGLNYEDAIVLSEDLVNRFSSLHDVVVEEILEGSDTVSAVLPVGTEVQPGETIARIGPLGPPQATEDGRARTTDNEKALSRERRVVAPEGGTVIGVSADPETLRVRLRVRRPLAVGDKMINRHGNKGVVSAILPVEDMPHLPDGTPVEMILNPLGVIRRLNLGQLWEAHLGLLHRLTASEPARAGRRANWEGLRKALADKGCPEGRMTLTMPDGTELRPADGQARGVVVGTQYFMKLDHMARDKLQVRYRGLRSVRSQQPLPGAHWARGHRVGSPQRMGEMELWCLQAVGAQALLQDLLINRSDRLPPQLSDDITPTLRSSFAHLAAAGLRGTFCLADGTAVTSDAEDLTAIQVGTVVGEQWAVHDGDGLEEIESIEAGDDPAKHTLYDDRHGGFLTAFSCPCGTETRQGVVCTQCHEPAAPVPTAARSFVRFGIKLAEPTPHPWSNPEREEFPKLGWLPILPPAYRSFGRDPLDRRYQLLAIANSKLCKALRDDDEDRAAPARRELGKALRDVVGRTGDQPGQLTIAARLGGKPGLLRRGLLGRRSDLSARGVIIPDPGLDPETVGLPALIYEQLRVGKSAIGLSVGGKMSQYLDVVVLNRQPSLHPYNLQGLRAVSCEGEAIRLNPLLCRAIAGDFDGDTVAVHRPVDPYAQKEAWEKLRPAVNLRSSAGGQPLAKLDLDVALGIRLLGATEQGRQLLSQHAAPYPDANADALSARIGDCLNLGREPALRCLADLQHHGFSAATGWSVGLLDLSALDPVVAFSLDTAVLHEQVLAAIHRSPLVDAHAVEAVGGLEALVQVLGVRRPMPGFDPRLVKEDAPPGNMWYGLPDDLYFACVNGALSRLAEKKLTTSYAGDLTKSLVEACYDVAIGREDCGLADSRSPLTCRDPNPCQRCYGPDPGTGELLPLGAQVGIRAGMLIGERGTQLAMKTFHGGGTGVAVGTRLDQLWGLFGEGKFEWNGKPTRLAGLFGADTVAALGDQLLATFQRVTEGEIASVHAAVVLRRLWEVFRSQSGGRGSLLKRASLTNRPLVDATTRGQLGSFLMGGKEAPSGGEGKLALILGGTR